MSEAFKGWLAPAPVHLAPGSSSSHVIEAVFDHLTLLLHKPGCAGLSALRTSKYDLSS